MTKKYRTRQQTEHLKGNILHVLSVDPEISTDKLAKLLVIRVDLARRLRREVVPYHVDELELTVRTSNCLSRAGIHTVEKLITMSSKDLLKIKYFGKKCLEDIIWALRSKKLKLKD